MLVMTNHPVRPVCLFYGPIPQVTSPTGEGTPGRAKGRTGLTKTTQLCGSPNVNKFTTKLHKTHGLWVFSLLLE